MAADAVSHKAEHGEGLPPLTVSIQAGGESRRMGRSKATVPFLGRPLIERIVTRVAPIADEILITTNEPENLGFLKQHPARDRIRLTRDIYDRRGSLTGLATALARARNEYVAVCACDMIFVSANLFLSEYRALLAREDADLVVPVLEKGYEPFYSIYRRERCLAGLTKAIDAGKQSIRSYMETMRILEFGRDEVDAATPEGLAFVNANTPQELAHAEELARAAEKRLRA